MLMQSSERVDIFRLASVARGKSRSTYFRIKRIGGRLCGTRRIRSIQLFGANELHRNKRNNTKAKKSVWHCIAQLEMVKEYTHAHTQQQMEIDQSMIERLLRQCGISTLRCAALEHPTGKPTIRVTSGTHS